MEKQPFASNDRTSEVPTQSFEWEIDPVCGMEVERTDQETEHWEKSGKAFYFCSSDCRQQFEAAPSDYGV